MEKISIFNYEAYYLDYLEGRLNKADTAMFLAFLDEYPECKMEADDMPVLELKDAVFSGKEDLKMVDEADAVTMQNLDHFLIAHVEGQLNEQKDLEVLNFVAKNNLADELNLVSAMTFAPDQAVGYAYKSELKKRGAIVLWPYYSAGVAAACILFFLLFWDNSPAKIDGTAGQVVAYDENQITPQIITTTNVIDDQPVESKNNVPSKAQTPPLQKESNNNNVSNISHSPARPIVSELDDKKLASITKSTFVNEDASNEKQDYAALHFSEMENPIEPITKAISKRTNTDLDFRRKKTTKKAPGGFFVKIGKFEFSRKKH